MRSAAVRSAIVAAALSLTATACGDDTTTASTTTTTITATTSTSPSVATTTTLSANATIDRVVDGDTIVVEIDGRRERVRLIGIDTPESVAENRPDQCYGEEASAYLRGLLPEGTPITLILDEEERDQYDRLLAYVIRARDQLFVNLDLIEQGYAGTLFYPPNTYYAERFGDAVREAQASGIGLWGVCGGPDVPLE